MTSVNQRVIRLRGTWLSAAHATAVYQAKTHGATRIQANTSTPADPTSTILQYCASTPDKFYMLTSSSQIVTTFNAIGTALSKLRVAQ